MRPVSGGITLVYFVRPRAVTDLSQDEVLDFRNEASIDEDDVLRLHAHMEVDDNFLNQFNV